MEKHELSKIDFEIIENAFNALLQSHPDPVTADKVADLRDTGYPRTISLNWGWGSFGANGIDAALYSGSKRQTCPNPSRVHTGKSLPGRRTEAARAPTATQGAGRVD